MDRQGHLDVDRYCLGKEYNNVHFWLDETYVEHADKKPYRHWLARHHIVAIAKKYGNYTPEYNAAYLHILFDYLKHFDIAYVPADELEAESMLKSLKVI